MLLIFKIFVSPLKTLKANFTKPFTLNFDKNVFSHTCNSNVITFEQIKFHIQGIFIPLPGNFAKVEDTTMTIQKKRKTEPGYDNNKKK